MAKLVFDTNALLSFSEMLNPHDEIIIPEIVIDELDNQKSGFTEKAYRAREAVRKLKSYNNIKIDHNFGRKNPLLDSSRYGKNDDLIVECARYHGASLVTGDYLAELKARAANIEVIDTLTANDEDYTGYSEVVMNEQQIADFYENLQINQYNLHVNQYIIIKDKKGSIIDTAKWNGYEHVLCHQKGFKTTMFGSFKPYDEYQVCALDSLINNQMTMIKGKAGSGKSILALNYAWNMIERNKYEKLIIFTNPVATKNSARLGFYPGTRIEKLLNSQTGTMLAGKFGDIMQVEMLIANGKIVLLPFSDIRGFDSTGMKAIIWVLESQNLDIELMKTGISRVGDDCKLILDGDYSGQVDMDAYAGYNNGMRRVSEIFRGQGFYGEVQLNYVHRSKMAKIADLL